MLGFGKKEKKEDKNTVGTFKGLKNVAGEVFKKRDYKIEKRELNKEDKKAILYTAIIVIGIALLLWFLPFTHQFMVDFVTLKF